MYTHFFEVLLVHGLKGFENRQAALVTMPWHLPSAPEILCAKPKLHRKLHAEGWKPSYYFGCLETLLTNGPLHAPKAECAWSSSWRSSMREFGCLQGAGDMAESTLSLHGNLSHTAWRTPRSQLPHKQLADVRTGLHLSFDPRTFLQWVDVLLTALPRVTGSPPHTWALHNRVRWTTCLRAPWAVAGHFLLGVLEIMTAQTCTKGGGFKCLHNIFESISCSGCFFFYFGFQDTKLLTLWRAHCKSEQTRALNCQLKQGEMGQPLPCIDSKDRGKKTCCGLDFCFA